MNPAITAIYRWITCVRKPHRKHKAPVCRPKQAELLTDRDAECLQKRIAQMGNT
jgi:hypothetical protein